MNQHSGSSIYSITNKLQDIPKAERPTGYYVYIHRKATDGTAFYVGSGKGNRAWRLYNRGKAHHETSVFNGVTIEIYRSGLTREQGLALEIELIAKIGIEHLVNVSPGGNSGSAGTIAHNVTPVECSNGMSFISATAASAWLQQNTPYKRAGGTSITACCKGKLNSVYGFNWRYAGSDKDLNFTSKSDLTRKRRSISIIRSDGTEFDSAIQAAAFMRGQGVISSKNANVGISSACKTGRKAFGYFWRYKEKAPE